MKPAVLAGELQLSNPAATGAFDDIVIGPKIRLTPERAGGAGVAVRVATRLPNAKHPSGLGQNTTDFYTAVILSRSWSGTQITVNLGDGILGDPLRGNRHLHSLLYGALAS